MNEHTNQFLGSEEQPFYTPTSDERTLAILSHILCLVTAFWAPLIIYLLKKDDSKFVAAHAKESLNFQISLVIYAIISSLLIVLLVGIVLLILLGLASVVLIIVATIKASENKLYRYPFTIRLIS